MCDYSSVFMVCFNDCGVAKWVQCSELCFGDAWIQRTKWRASDIVSRLLRDTITRKLLTICVSVQAFSRDRCFGRWSDCYGTVYCNILTLSRQPLTKHAYSTDQFSGLRKSWSVAPARMKSNIYAEYMQKSRFIHPVHYIAMTPTDHTSVPL